MRDGFRATTLQYQGLDGRTRKTHIHRLWETEKIRDSRLPQW